MKQQKRVFTLLFLVAFATLTFAQQPFGGCWHLNYVKTWTPESDPDAKFNRSTVPLQPRFYDDGIKANQNQHYTGKIAACLTMNPMASLTPSQGANNFIGYNPNEWQYMDLVVWWGGSAAEGVLTVPTAPVIDAAHLNGVKILGNAFFAPGGFGGQPQWVYEMLTREGDQYPYAKKLYEIAKFYGFDGWLFNEETLGRNVNDKSEWAKFITYFYACAAADGDTNMEIQWYDAGTDVAGSDGVTGILRTSPRTSFFPDYKGFDKMATNMAAVKMLGYTEEQAFSKLYNGVECAQAGLYGNKSHFETAFPADAHKGSLQLFNPEEHIWKDAVRDLLGTANDQGTKAYAAMNSAFSNSSGFFVNNDRDPSNTSGRSGGIWPGLANAVQERSAIQAKPFVTSFGTGLGKHRFVAGQNKGTQDWYHRGMQDVLPTWRWWVEPTNGGSKSDLSFKFNWDDAFNAGSSLIVSGKLNAGAEYLTRLFKTKLVIAAGDKFEMVYKTENAGTMVLKIATADNPTVFTAFPITETSTQNGWSVATVDISSLSGKTAAILALSFKSAATVDNYKVTIGQLGIMSGSYAPAETAVVNLHTQKELKEEISDIRVIWDAPANTADVHHYNVYLERNGEKKLVGQTRNEGFYIPKFTRTTGENSLTVSVAVVTKDMKEKTETKLVKNFPQMKAPEVSIKPGQTMVKMGEEVTVTAIATNKPTTYTWTVPENAELVSQTDNKAVFKFSAEGYYTMKVNVVNEVGSTDAEVTGLIEVSNNKKLENVAKGKKIHDVSAFLDPEKPEYLIDGVEIPGNIRHKWCIGGKTPNWVIIDLQANYKLYQFKVFDCGHRENAADNFKNYKVELSLDGEKWTEVLNVKDIPATWEYNTKIDWIKPTTGRYVRFTPYDDEMPMTIRIWEFQAFGTMGNMSVESKEPVSTDINTVTPINLKYSLGGDEKASNFNISVASESSAATVENLDVSDTEIKFDVKAGPYAGKTAIAISITNGDFTQVSKIEFNILDASLKNILPGLTPTATIQGTDYDEENNPNASTGAVGIKGLNDESENTWWSSPYDDHGYATQTFVFDLKEKHAISSVKGVFRAGDWIYLPTGFKAYIADTDEPESYKLIAEKVLPGNSSPTRIETSLSLPEAAIGRYLKFEVISDYRYCLSISELEAYGKLHVLSGLESNMMKEIFNIYPNPVKRGVNVVVDTEVGNLIQVLSLQGNILYAEKATAEKLQLPTDKLSVGAYIVTNEGKNSRKTAKLIIK